MRLILFVIALLFSGWTVAASPVPVPITEASHTLGAVQYSCPGAYCYVRLAWFLDPAAPMTTCVRVPNAPVAPGSGWTSLSTYDPALTPETNFGLSPEEMAACLSDNSAPPVLTWKTYRAPGTCFWCPSPVYNAEWLTGAARKTVGGTWASLPCEPATMATVAGESYHFVTGPFGSRGLAVCTLQ